MSENVAVVSFSRPSLNGIPQSRGKNVKTFRWDHRATKTKPLHDIYPGLFPDGSNIGSCDYIGEPF